MADLPTLKMHMSPSDKGEQFCRLRLTLSDDPEIDAGILELPFSLELVPTVQKVLNLIEELPPDSSAQPLANESDKEEMLMSLELLDNYGRVYTDVHKRVGQKLGSALLRNQKFKDKLQAFYEAARDVHGGHIVLEFDPAALRLAALPWELVYVESAPLLMYLGGNTLLACTRVIFDQPLSSTRQRQSSIFVVRDKLRVLSVTSYQGMDVISQLLQQRARKELQDALSGLPAEIDSLEHVTMSALERRLADGPPVDVLDYYGHGSFEDGYATLRMGGGDGGPELVPAAKLKSLKNLPPLVVLHACNSAQLDIYRLRDSLALNLSEAGVQAVVAMQLNIRMPVVAEHIVSTFYKSLANGFSLPIVVAEVRRKLYATEKDAVSWFVPVLYMRQFNQQPYLRLEQAPPPPANPFKGLGDSIDSERFVGRETQIRQLWGRLRAGENLSIVGPSGSGKSAMLALIATEGEYRLNAKVVWLPIHVEWRRVEAQRELVQRLGGKRETELTSLLEGRHLILLLDNLDTLENAGKGGLGVRQWLRRLTEDRTHGKAVQLVATSYEPLGNVFYYDHFQPLHDVMSDPIFLGPFSEDEGRRFISIKLVGTPFGVQQFEDLLKGSHEDPRILLPRNLEKACRIRYDELCEHVIK